MKYPWDVFFCYAQQELSRRQEINLIEKDTPQFSLFAVLSSSTTHGSLLCHALVFVCPFYNGRWFLLCVCVKKKNISLHLSCELCMLVRLQFQGKHVLTGNDLTSLLIYFCGIGTCSFCNLLIKSWKSLPFIEKSNLFSSVPISSVILFSVF